MSPHGIHARGQTAFRLPPELLARLRDAADASGETMTAIVERAITTELDRIAGRTQHDHAQ